MIDAFGWKSIFWLVLAIMAVSFVFSGIVFENVLELQDKKFGVLSFTESILAFGGITLGIGNISSYGLVSVQAGLPLLTSFRTVAGAIGSAVFVGIMAAVRESSAAA